LNILCSPAGIVSGEYPRQGTADLARAGFSDLLLDFASLSCSPGELEFFGRERKIPPRRPLVSENPSLLEERVQVFLAEVRARQMRTTVAVAPYLPVDTKRDDLGGLVETLARESIRAAKRAGCRFLIVKPCFAGSQRAGAWERNRSAFLRLAPLAKECGVMLLLENLCRDLNGHLVRGLMSDADEAADWIDRLNETAGEERFGAVVNLGSLNLCGQNAHDFIRTLDHRLKAVILTENDGSQNASLLPFSAASQGQSRMDWLNIFRGLREVGFDGQLILQIGDTASAFSPILRPALLTLAKATAEYIRWQADMENLLRRYPSRVLFGAGNMCRAYMKCYGEAYPPLFTCDNNPRMWGTEFCGLRVMKPESLKELPAETAVFICNVYYREIEEQLTAMGIKNPIEYFNDEYMPSFYFERLEEKEGNDEKDRRANPKRDR